MAPQRKDLNDSCSAWRLIPITAKKQKDGLFLLALRVKVFTAVRGTGGAFYCLPGIKLPYFLFASLQLYCCGLEVRSLYRCEGSRFRVVSTHVLRSSKNTDSLYSRNTEGQKHRRLEGVKRKMGNAGSAASAAKATMQVNKMISDAGKGIENLTKPRGKNESKKNESDGEQSKSNGGIMNLKIFERQKRQNQLSKE